MPAFVLDASMTLAWCFEDEATDFTDDLLEQLRAGGEALTSSIWPLEVANVIRLSERRNRISRDEGDALLRFVHGLPVEIMVPTTADIYGAIADLARDETLTVYDAAYLYLAETEALPLATLDRPLQQAARRRGVPLLEP